MTKRPLTKRPALRLPAAAILADGLNLSARKAVEERLRAEAPPPPTETPRCEPDRPWEPEGWYTVYGHESGPYQVYGRASAEAAVAAMTRRG